MSKRGSNEGSIHHRKDGRWVAVVHLGYEQGRRRRKSLYGQTRQEVAEKLTAALKTKQDGLPQTAERQTVQRFLANWLETVRPSLRPKTYIGYEAVIRLHILPSLQRVPLSRLQPYHLQRLYQERLTAGLAPMTVRHIHALLHRSLRDAHRWGLVARNVADLVDAPRAPRNELRTLNRQEASRLLAAARADRLDALYVLALTTGMRQGELLALRWRDLDLNAATAKVGGSLQRIDGKLSIVEPKTSSSWRQVALTTAAVEALRRHRAVQAEERLGLGAAWEDRDLVFANEAGRPIDVRNLMRRSFLPLLERASLPRIRFHDLRHTAATLLLEQGTHPKLVAELLGHSRIATTIDLYSHVTPAMHRQAAATMDALLAQPR